MNKTNFSIYAITIIALMISLPVNQYANSLSVPIVLQPPTNLSANPVSSSEIDLSWTAPSNLGNLLLTGYMIERSTDGGSTWSTIASNTGNTSTRYSDSGLAHSTTYTYRVSAITLLVTSSPSNTASATTLSVVPSSPTNLSAVTVSSSQINLSWIAPSDNGGSPIIGYQIERSTNGGNIWTTIVPNTGSTAATYFDTGLNSNTSYTYRVSAINNAGTSSPSNVASATTENTIHLISQIQSGLVASDPLNNETKTQQQLQANSKYWRYGGDAPNENAPFDFFKDTNGLHIGVQAPSNGTWAGFYAVTPNTNAALFHAIITTPVSTIPSKNNWYENGLYVQTSQPLINYVTCFSTTSIYGTVWGVASVNGTATQGTTFNGLYFDSAPNQPLTRDCTIITNGNNYLKVYLDGTMVYTSNTLNLQMPGPFNAYLEPQTSYAGQVLNGTYTNYYAASDENIKITNLPTNVTRVDLVDTFGNVLVSSSVSSSSVILDVGKFDFPLDGNIKAYDSNNVLVASTSGTSSIYGGDIYSSS